MKLLVCVIAVLLFSAQSRPKEGKIESVHDRKVDFARLTTYAWERGQEAFDAAAHKAIVTAIDAEMAARGFRPLAGSGADVRIRYHTLARTDVVLDKLDEVERENKPAPTRNVGRLVIVMSDGSNHRIWAADTIQPLDPDPTKVYREIGPIVGRMFATYPRRKE